MYSSIIISRYLHTTNQTERNYRVNSICSLNFEILMYVFFSHSHQKSGGGSPVSLQFWQRGSKPSHREMSPLALQMPVTVISVWTRPPLPWQAPLPHLREVEEHLTAPDLGLLSHKTRATPAAG